MSFRLLSAILRGPWLIEPEYAQAHLPFIHNLLSGKAEGLKIDSKKIELTAGSTGRLLAYSGEDNHPYYDNISSFPTGTILVVPFSGPVMKDDNCGSLGSQSYSELFNRISLASNIAGVVLVMDGPGGQVYGTQMMADAVKNCGLVKPVVGFVYDGIAASATYWIASACTELYVSHESSKVGSIGALCEIPDMNGFYEGQGLKIHTIYAPQSTDKNKEYNDALKGNYDGVQEELKGFVDFFISSIEVNRGEKLNLAKGNPFTGKMYGAKDAQAIGLIDGIKTMDEVISRAEELIKPQNSNQNSINNTNTTNMSKNNYAAINAALGVATLESTEEGVFLNEEQLTLIESGLTPDATLVTAEAHQAVIDGLATVNATIDATNNELKTLAVAAGVEVAEGDFNASSVITALSTKITELKSTSTAKHSATAAEGDTVLSDADAMAFIGKLPHNKED